MTSRATTAKKSTTDVMLIVPVAALDSWKITSADVRRVDCARSGVGAHDAVRDVARYDSAESRLRSERRERRAHDAIRRAPRLKRDRVGARIAVTERASRAEAVMRPSGETLVISVSPWSPRHD